MSVGLLFSFWSSALGIPDGLLSSMCYVESNHRIYIISRNDGGSDSYGICQVKKAAFRQVGLDQGDKEADMLNPDKNIEAAGRYLVWQYRRYGSWNKAIVAYNQGHYRGSLTPYHRKVIREWTSKRYPKKLEKGN